MPNTLANPNPDRARRGDALVEQLIASPAADALVVATASPVNAVIAATAFALYHIWRTFSDTRTALYGKYTLPLYSTMYFRCI